MEISVLGVVGAGTMGSGIAQIAAEGGYQVVMRDIEDKLVQKGLDGIKKNLDKAVEKGKKEQQEAEKALQRIKGTVQLEDLRDADFVIEAAVENMEVKKAIFQELDGISKEGAVIASNTSGLSITEMAAVTSKPNKVIGMHFFNPVQVMKLVEVIKGSETDEETFKVTFDLSQKLGKEPIAVNEAPLFVVNRILVPMINEAAFVLMEGISSAEDIDRGMKLGANHPIGPLALADLVGIDVVLFVMENLYQETGDSKYRPCPLIRKMVRAGHLGRKAGKGFYSY